MAGRSPLVTVHRRVQTCLQERNIRDHVYLDAAYVPLTESLSSAHLERLELKLTDQDIMVWQKENYLQIKPALSRSRHPTHVLLKSAIKRCQEMLLRYPSQDNFQFKSVDDDLKYCRAKNIRKNYFTNQPNLELIQEINGVEKMLLERCQAEPYLTPIYHYSRLPHGSISPLAKPIIYGNLLRTGFNLKGKSTFMRDPTAPLFPGLCRFNYQKLMQSRRHNSRFEIEPETEALIAETEELIKRPG